MSEDTKKEGTKFVHTTEPTGMGYRSKLNVLKRDYIKHMQEGYELLFLEAQRFCYEFAVFQSMFFKNPELDHSDKDKQKVQEKVIRSAQELIDHCVLMEQKKVRALDG